MGEDKTERTCLALNHKRAIRHCVGGELGLYVVTSKERVRVSGVDNVGRVQHLVT